MDYAPLLKEAEKSLARYEEINELLYAPEVIADGNLFMRLNSEKTALEDVATTYARLKKVNADKEECEALAVGSEKNLFKEEALQLSEEGERLVEQLKHLFLRDVNDPFDAIIELRAGDGGGLFCRDLTAMYKSFAEKHKFSFESEIIPDGGGIKEATLLVGGKNAYALLKNERGLHYANFGKSQKGEVSVVILPQTQTDVTVDDKDLRIDIFHSNGAGGQNINKVETAVRITHFPTGLVVTCQDERSQLKNKERAMKILLSRIHKLHEEEMESKAGASRRKQLQKGRIRTYDYTLSVAKDQRTGMTVPLDVLLYEGGLVNLTLT